jgi:hypothetical protein
MHLKSTADTPEVLIDESNGILSIRGRSLPEDAWAFYEPLILWGKSTEMEGNSALSIELQLEYFNSSSGRYLLELLSIIEKRLGEKAHVIWVSEADDELMQEKGQEFDELLKLPFEFRTI